MDKVKVKDTNGLLYQHMVQYQLKSYYVCVAGVHKAQVVFILVSTNEDKLRATVYSDVLG